MSEQNYTTCWQKEWRSQRVLLLHHRMMHDAVEPNVRTGARHSSRSSGSGGHSSLKIIEEKRVTSWSDTNQRNAK
jgi:hypothetical protein